jgi:ATP-binding cassette subfamily B protein
LSLADRDGLPRAQRDLLILDEPSAGLDAEAEHAIHERLVAMREARTSLLISHRLGSVRDADVICVLAGGRVAEQGTHAELMAADGEYSRLFALQASGYHNDGPDGDGTRRTAERKDGVRRHVLAAMARQPSAGRDGLAGTRADNGRGPR